MKASRDINHTALCCNGLLERWIVAGRHGKDDTTPGDRFDYFDWEKTDGLERVIIDWNIGSNFKTILLVMAFCLDS